MRSLLRPSRAGIPLPMNFDMVPLSKKEIAAVRRVYPDYVPDHEERSVSANARKDTEKEAWA